MNLFKGKIDFNPDNCILCATCQFVCPAGAIDIQRSKEKKTSYDFTVWHNTCTLCGNCEYFCPTKAIYMSEDTAQSSLQEDKYTNIMSKTVTYSTCTLCGEEMIKIPDALLLKGFGFIDEHNKALFSLCPQCRQKQTFLKRVQS